MVNKLDYILTYYEKEFKNIMCKADISYENEG
jgi:hypothetical protein